VITKIAAGEVIERPASVIKELLENSIDAGARRIDIDIEQGGTELIRIVDDGHGIDPEDLALAFSNHATSKLRAADDLFRIGTMGFRGEALASIGGIARVLMQSRAEGHEVGAEIRNDGGELSEVRPWNGAQGTRIEVRHLFYNVPVRKKFLRTISTEVGHVCEAVQRIALAFPSLHIVLRHNSKLVYEVPSSAGLTDRIALFFGGDIRDQLYDVQLSQGPATLSGYIADPACERGNAKWQYLFLNGRWIRDRSLGHAVQDAYRGLLMVGRYAVSFLFIDLPPDLVDVNVHPTKCEVRFRDSQALFHLVRSGVRNRLHKANIVPQLQMPINEGREPVATAEPWKVTEVPMREYSPPPVPTYDPPLIHSETRTVNETPQQQPSRNVNEVPRPPEIRLASAPHRAIQIHNSYLVVETADGMLVIDQHALHERILFEQLQRRFRAGQLEKQRLLIPEPIDLPGPQAAMVLEAREALLDLGLEIEDFGGGTILLSAYPAVLGRASPATILEGVVDQLIHHERPPTRDQLLNHLLATMACKAAVKANDPLSQEEISALMAQRELADDSHHCPHGRPTSLLFSRKELEKQFGRI